MHRNKIMDKEKIKIVDEYMGKIYQIFGLFKTYEEILVALDQFFIRMSDTKGPYLEVLKGYDIKEISRSKGKKYKKIKKEIVYNMPHKLVFVPEVYFYDKAPNGVMIWLFIFVKTGLFSKKLLGVDVFCFKDGILDKKEK